MNKLKAMNKWKLISIIILPILLGFLYFYETPIELDNVNYVYDELGLLEDTTINSITNINRNLNKKNNGAKIEVYTVDLAGESSSSKVSKILNKAFVDGLNKDKGLVLMIATNKPSDDYYIEARVGLELEKTLPSKRLSLILDNKLSPHIKNNNINEGVIETVEELSSIITKEYGNHYSEELQYKNKKSGGLINFILKLVIFGILFSIAFYVLHKLTGNQSIQETIIELKKMINDFLNQE